MCVHRDLLAVQMRGVDHRAHFIVEGLATESQANAAVDAAGGGDLDHVDATRHLLPHRAPTGLDAVAEIAIVIERGMQLAAKSEGGVAMSGRGRHHQSGVQNPRAFDLARRNRIA
jgi:hypothetical protein